MTDTNNQSEGAAATRVPESGLLDEIVRRIVEVAAPESIILFGSAARGEWSPDSDIDLLVVKSDVEHRRMLAQKIHLHMYGIDAAIDIVVVTPEDIDYLRGKVGNVVAPAMNEGREIYAA
jgi:predicted nucleotidyltransferase